MAPVALPVGRSRCRFIAARAGAALHCAVVVVRPRILGPATAVGVSARSRRLMLAERHPPAPGPRSDAGDAGRQLLEVAAWRVCRDVVRTRCRGDRSLLDARTAIGVEHDCNQVSEAVATAPPIGVDVGRPRHQQTSVTAGPNGSESASMQRAWVRLGGEATEIAACSGSRFVGMRDAARRR